MYWKFEDKEEIDSLWKRCEFDEEEITTEIELYPNATLTEISIKQDDNGFISHMNIKSYDQEKDLIESKDILEDNFEEQEPQIIAIDDEYKQRFIFGAFESLINSNISLLYINPK